MAEKTITALKQDITDFLPENSQQEISATDLTDRLKDLLDSVNVKAQNELVFGLSDSLDKVIEVRRSAGNNPKLRWNSGTNKWQYSNDGTTYNDIGSGSAAIWGAITGTLTDQTDLNNALSAKEPTISPKKTAFNKDYDDVTINLDGGGDLQVKDAGVTFAKLNPSMLLEEWLASGPASLTDAGEQGQKFANDFELWNCVSANQWTKIAKGSPNYRRKRQDHRTNGHRNQLHR